MIPTPHPLANPFIAPLPHGMSGYSQREPPSSHPGSRASGQGTNRKGTRSRVPQTSHAEGAPALPKARPSAFRSRPAWLRQLAVRCTPPKRLQDFSIKESPQELLGRGSCTTSSTLQTCPKSHPKLDIYLPRDAPKTKSCRQNCPAAFVFTPKPLLIKTLPVTLFLSILYKMSKDLTHVLSGFYPQDRGEGGCPKVKFISKVPAKPDNP